MNAASNAHSKVMKWNLDDHKHEDTIPFDSPEELITVRALVDEKYQEGCILEIAEKVHINAGTHSDDVPYTQGYYF